MQSMLRTALVPLMIGALTACAGEAEPGAEVTEGLDEAAESSLPIPAPAPAEQEAREFIDPETATREELMSVPGVDAALADSIIAARPIEAMTEIDAILAANLEETEREGVYRVLWKPIDLNTAADEEILLIPGIGDRMLHEFKEYRPYQQIEQFRREMGKYVDDEEVARMERYVEVR